MSYKILLVGDVHIMDKNISSIDLLEEQILKTLEEKKIDECIVLGDILHNHERLKSIPHNRAHKFLKNIASMVHTFVLVGNHDYINNSQFLSENHWMECLKGIKNLVVVDNVMKYNIETQISLCLCPYVPNGRYIEALKTKIKNIRNDCDFYFSHVCVNNMKMGSIIVNDADDWKEDYPPLFVGHEHTFQEISKNCICTGSSISTSASEGVDKYLVVLNINVQENKHLAWSYNKIVLDLPRNKTLYYKDVAELKTSIGEKKNFLDSKTKCSYRLVVHGPEEEFKAFSKTTLYHETSLKARIVWKESHSISSSTKELIRSTDFVSRDQGFFEIFLKHIKNTTDLLQIYNELYGEENE